MANLFSNKVLLAAICFGAAGTPALAQSNDWELSLMPDRKATVAVAAFDNGLTLVSRCVDKAFDIMISGLPETDETARLLEVGVGEVAEMRNVSWTVGSNKSTAFSRLPMRLARELMQGGTIRIRIPAQNGGRTTLYVMETEPSVTAIAETLTACDLPLVDPRDSREASETLENLPFDIIWSTLPMPSSKQIEGISDFRTSHITISCLTAEGGSLADCRIESAHPYHSNMNRLILNASRRGRLKHKTTGEPVSAGREIIYSVPITIQ